MIFELKKPGNLEVLIVFSVNQAVLVQFAFA